MAAPAYGDLGKQARDVFGRGYHFGVFKLDVKKTTESGVEFSNEINFNQDSGKVFGAIETKNKIKEYGVTLSQKINTDNVFGFNVSIQDQLVKGLKTTIDSSYAHQTGAKTCKLKNAFVNSSCALNCDMDIDHARPVINASAVFKYQTWLAGYNMHFDTQKCTIAKNNFAIGFAGSDYTLHASVDNGQVFDTSIFQKVTPRLDYGINFNWTAGSNNTRYGVGCKYSLSEDASIRTKLNDSCQLGLGYQQKLHEGVTMTISTLLDAKNFKNGNHKLGFGFEFEAY